VDVVVSAARDAQRKVTRRILDECVAAVVKEGEFKAVALAGIITEIARRVATDLHDEMTNEHAPEMFAVLIGLQLAIDDFIEEMESGAEVFAAFRKAGLDDEAIRERLRSRDRGDAS
jgi:hypothetical protein